MPCHWYYDSLQKVRLGLAHFSGALLNTKIYSPTQRTYTCVHTQQRVDFGTITDYVAPKDRFPGSIMNLSNTGTSSIQQVCKPILLISRAHPILLSPCNAPHVAGGGGRGSDKGSIIGDVINHGKKQYWLKGKPALLNFHDHH